MLTLDDGGVWIFLDLALIRAFNLLFIILFSFDLRHFFTVRVGEILILEIAVNRVQLPVLLSHLFFQLIQLLDVFLRVTLPRSIDELGQLLLRLDNALYLSLGRLFCHL